MVRIKIPSDAGSIVESAGRQNTRSCDLFSHQSRSFHTNGHVLHLGKQSQPIRCLASPHHAPPFVTSSEQIISIKARLHPVCYSGVGITHTEISKTKMVTMISVSVPSLVQRPVHKHL